MKDDKTFASLVAKLNKMGESGEPAKKRQEIKVIKKAKREGKKLHHDANVNAMATLMEAIGKPDVEEGKPNHLKGKHKLKSVPAGETDGTTKNPSRGKLVGEENLPIDEDLIASLKTQFRELLEPKKVAPVEEGVHDDVISNMTFTDGHADYTPDGQAMNNGAVDYPEINSWHLDSEGNVKPEATEPPDPDWISEYLPDELLNIPGGEFKWVPESVTNEAVGEFAEPLYTLQDELGLEDNVLVDELARWMDGQDIKDFVDTFRRHHDMDPVGKSKRGHWPDDEKSEGKEVEESPAGPHGEFINDQFNNHKLEVAKWLMKQDEHSQLEEIEHLLDKAYPSGDDDKFYKEWEEVVGTNPLPWQSTGVNPPREEGIVGTIGQGIDDLAVGAGKLAWKGAKKAAPHVKKGAKAGANMVGRGVKKGAKKLSKIGSKHTSYDPKTGKTTTTTGMANA